MNFSTYAKNFTEACLASGKTDSFIADCLAYAEILASKKLPIIYDQKHLSLLVGYKESYLLSASNSQHSFYSHFLLPKKNGGNRDIFAPYPSLREIQRWILDNILNNIEVSRYAKAYIKNTSIIDNARFHRNQKYVLRLDIKDFFPSIKFKNVYKIFASSGYSKQVSTLLSNLCTLFNSIPQGAPTSPALSNIFFYEIDKRIGGYIIPRKIRYTRYADDLVFSGEFDGGKLISFIGKVIEEYGLKLNAEKTRIMPQHKRQQVTGIVTNSHLNAPRALRRKLTQEAYYIDKFGLHSHVMRQAPFTPNYIAKLLGQAHFVRFVNPKTPKIDWIISVFTKAKREQ